MPWKKNYYSNCIKWKNINLFSNENLNYCYYPMIYQYVKHKSLWFSPLLSCFSLLFTAFTSFPKVKIWFLFSAIHLKCKRHDSRNYCLIVSLKCISRTEMLCFGLVFIFVFFQSFHLPLRFPLTGKSKLTSRIFSWWPFYTALPSPEPIYVIKYVLQSLLPLGFY